MSREIMIIAKDKSGVISNNIVKIGENGEHIVIKGTKDTFYEIKDMATNRAPDQIYTKRFKNDLKLKINPKGGALDGVGEADVTIENYCANGNCEIVGVHESGEYYQYVPQSGDADLGTTKMADGEFAYQSLGTVEAGGFGPLSALPLAGLAGLGGGGGGSKPDTTAPDAPNLTMVTDNTDSFAGATYYGAQVDTGSWNIDNTTGNISISGNVNVVNGKIITNDSTPTLSGTGEAGTTVKIYDGDPDNPSNLVGETIVASDGTWSITTDELQESSFVDTDPTHKSPLQNVEHILNITLTDTAGNISEPTPIDIIVDTLMTYDLGHLTFTNLEDGNERSDNIGDIKSGDNHYFTGTFTISDNLVAEYGSDEPENIAYQEGDKVYIEFSLVDDAGNVVAVYQIGGPTGPTATVGSNGSWSITIDPAQTYYNKTTGKMETLPDGNYTNQVIVRTLSGDEYTYASEKPGAIYGSFGIDTTAPDVSQAVSITSPEHTLIINIVDSTPILFAAGDKTDGLQRDSDYLIGNGVNEVIIYKNGDLSTPAADMYIGADSAISSVSWTDSSVVNDGVYTYQLETIDVAGNSSGVGEAFYAVIDANADGIYSGGATTDVTGTAGNEVFQTNVLNLSFKLDGGAGIDTLTLTPLTSASSLNNLTLDGAKVDNFEIYNIGKKSTLTITDLASVKNSGSEYTDHALTIQGIAGSKVDLDTTWNTSGQTIVDGVKYNVYHNSAIDAANTSYDLWIQTSIGVI